MKFLTTIEVNGRRHVLLETKRTGTIVDPETGKRELAPQSNYMGTRMALCGVLKKRQSLKDFEARFLIQKKSPKSPKS